MYQQNVLNQTLTDLKYAKYNRTTIDTTKIDSKVVV